MLAFFLRFSCYSFKIKPCKRPYIYKNWKQYQIWNSLKQAENKKNVSRIIHRQNGKNGVLIV